jgi:hypothetical protein
MDTNVEANTRSAESQSTNTPQQAFAQNEVQGEFVQRARRQGPEEPAAPRVAESSTTRRSRTSSSSAASTNAGAQSSTQASSSAANTGASNTQSASSGAQDVAQCMLNNDFQCVVNALRNRANTEVEFNQLVTAYRGLRNQAAAEQTMRRYLARFPEGRYAERYRDMLGQ